MWVAMEELQPKLILQKVPQEHSYSKLNAWIFIHVTMGTSSAFLLQAPSLKK